MKKIVLAGFAVIMLLFFVAAEISMAGSSPSPSLENGAVSLGFDDGIESQYQYAWPLMQQRSMTGTFYAISGDVGSYGSLTKTELLDLQTYGNEIASHSIDHPDFTTLSTSQIQQECQQSKATLQGMGLTINNFAYPCGASNPTVDNIVKTYYHSGRYGGGVMTLPFSDFHVTGWTSYSNTDAEDLAQYKQGVDMAAQSKGWTVLYFHDFFTDDANGGRITDKCFAQVLDYIQSKGVQVLTVEQALNMNIDPPTGTVTVKLQPFGLTEKYTVTDVLSYTAPDTITKGTTIYRFQKWNDGITSKTRSLQPSKTYTVNYR